MARVEVTPGPLSREGLSQSDRLAAALADLLGGIESRDSRAGYERDWRGYAGWLADGGLDPLVARTYHVQTYLLGLRERGLARATRSRALSVIRSVYAALVRADLLALNPALDARVGRVDRSPKTPWLTEDDIQKVLAVPPGTGGKRDWLIVRVLVGMGWRASEVARLHSSQFTKTPDGRPAVRVAVKGGRQGVVSIPGWLWADLRASVTLGGPLFPRVPGGSAQVGRGHVWSVVKRSALAAGLDPSVVTPHSFRRSFVTIALARGVPLAEVQAAVVHANAATTMLYDKALRGLGAAPGEGLRPMSSSPGDAAGDAVGGASLGSRPSRGRQT